MRKGSYAGREFPANLVGFSEGWRVTRREASKGG